MSRPHHPLVAVLYLSLAILFLTGMDITAKFMRDDHTVAEIMFFRALIGVPIILMVSLSVGQFKVTVQAKHLGQHLARTACMAFGLGCFMYAVATVPLATLNAIAFVTPLFMVLLSIPFLGERVGRHRWAAIFIGFAGVLLIIQPDSKVPPEALWMLLGSVGWAMGLILTRRYPADLNSLSVAFWFLVFMLLGSGVFVAQDISHALTVDWIGALALGVCGAFGQLFIILSYRMADISFLAPFEYTALIWAVIADITLFAVWPDLYIWMGSALIIGSGLYVAHRERLQKGKNHA